MQQQHIDGRDFNENDIPIGLYFTVIYYKIPNSKNDSVYIFAVLTSYNHRLSLVNCANICRYAESRFRDFTILKNIKGALPY